jgi:hypothetical protein
LTETVSVSDAVDEEVIKGQITKEQRNIIEKVIQAIENFIASKEIESITINFGFLVVVIKGKKGTT